MTQMTTINEEEINQFSAQSEYWWDESGPFKPLHRMNPIRLRYIKENILKYTQSSDLKTIKVLDVGCGGGLLTEPLARMGANIYGIDASAAAIDVAKSHAHSMNLAINYECCAIESLNNQLGNFDVITALEIIEHVNHPQEFINSCLQRLNPNGLIFFSTINKTPQSYFKAIIAAEYILRMIPRGTHNWAKFVNPSELARYLRQQNYMILDSSGMLYNPVKGEWSFSKDHTSNYICCAGRA